METLEKRPPLFTNRKLLGLTIPIALNSLMAILMGAADSVMVSAAGATAVSAVSLVDAVNNVFVTAFDAIPIGGAVVTSQYIGAKQFDKARQSVRQILYAGFSIAFLCAAILLCLRKQVLSWIYGSIEKAVFDQAVTYFTITLLSFPFVVIGCTATATLRAMAKNRQAVTITITVNLLNIVGNAILVYGLKTGVAGAAISTLFGRIVWCVWGLIAIRSKKLPFFIDKLLHIRLNWDIMKRVLRVGVSNGFENALFYIGRLLVSSLISSLGTIYIAAYSVSQTLNNFGWVLLGAFATTSLTVVGQCIGAGEKEQARQNAKKLLLWAAVTMYVTFTLVLIFRNPLVKMFQFTPQELEVAAYYTGVAAVLTMCSFYFMSFTPVYIFRAAGDIRYPFILAVTTMFVFRVGLSYLLCKVFHMGLLGVFLGMFADWLCRFILNTVRFRSGKWLDKKLI